MSVDSGQTRVSDLTYRVYARALHPEWFETHAFKRLNHQGWHADLRIIPGGHAIVWSAGPASLTEVLCTRELELPEAGLLHRSSVRHERSTSLGLSTRISFHSCVEAERVESEVFAHMNDEILLDASRGGLFHQSRCANRLVVPAIRLMKVEVTRAYVAMHSTHTFPEDLAIVRVESLIDLK